MDIDMAYGLPENLKERHTNIEAMWLVSGLRPKYRTIDDFRKNYSKAFREVFRRFVCLLNEWNLIEGETVAIDSFIPGTTTAIKGEVKRVLTCSEDIIPRLAKPAQAEIYAHRVKLTEDISTVVNTRI